MQGKYKVRLSTPGVPEVTLCHKGMYELGRFKDDQVSVRGRAMDVPDNAVMSPEATDEFYSTRFLGRSLRVSADHLTLYLEGERVMVQDMNSANGTVYKAPFGDIPISRKVLFKGTQAFVLGRCLPLNITVESYVSNVVDVEERPVEGGLVSRFLRMLTG